MFVSGDGLVPYDQAPARGTMFHRLSKKWMRAAKRYNDRSRRSRAMIDAIKDALNESHPARKMSDIIEEVQSKIGFRLRGQATIFFYRKFFKIARAQKKKKRRRNRVSNSMFIIGAGDLLPLLWRCAACGTMMVGCTSIACWIRNCLAAMSRSSNVLNNVCHWRINHLMMKSSCARSAGFNHQPDFDNLCETISDQ